MTLSNPARIIYHEMLLPEYPVVEVLHAYVNPAPQLNAALDHLAEPSKHWIVDSGPSSEPRLDCDFGSDDASPVSPRPLNRRLTAEQREAIVIAYGAGAPQKVLAVQYGISDRSVKRLVSRAREAGMALQTRATLESGPQIRFCARFRDDL